MSSILADSDSVARQSMSYETGSDDPVSGTTTVHARISLPVEDLLQQLTRPSGSSSEYDDDDRKTIYFPRGYDGDPKTTVSTARMPMKARASSLVRIKHNPVSGTYEVELNIDIDLPTVDVSCQLLDNVRPLASASGVGHQRTSHENFSDVRSIS